MLRNLLREHSPGQSLVEVALFLPIFLVIFAGLIEVSQLVITSSRVTTAVDNGSRFGANGGLDEAITLVTLGTVTQTLPVRPELWDVWVIRGTINEAGDNFSEWEMAHTYGISQTQGAQSLNEAGIRARVLAEMQLDHQGLGTDAAGLGVVGVYASHDVTSITGMEGFMPDIFSAERLSVKRAYSVGTHAEIDGCLVFPIGLTSGVRSVKVAQFPGDIVYPVPPPKPPRVYPQGPHREDLPILQAREGVVYQVAAEWLQLDPWNGSALVGDLSWPGAENYNEPGDPTDVSLHVGDLVAQTTWDPAADGILRQHVDRNRVLRMVIYNEPVRALEFITARIIGIGDGYLLLEALEIDRSCGQVIGG